MKKIFTALGVVSAALLIMAVIGFFILNHVGRGLDEESKSYVDSNLPQIIAGWNVEELTNRASPELMKAASKEQIEKLFKVFSKRLGPLEEYKGSNGQSNISVTTKNGKVVTGAYIAEAVFEKAPATIRFKIIKHGNQWQILGFHVNSETLLSP